MPAIRMSLKLREKDANERISRRQGPKSKPLEQCVLNLQLSYSWDFDQAVTNFCQIKAIQQVEHSYSWLWKIQVLMWIKYYCIPNNSTWNTAIKMRLPTLDEASLFFQIPKSTIADWTWDSHKIIEQAGNSRCNTPIVFVCMWLDMGGFFFDAFVKWREQEKPVRDGWFRRSANELWKQTYPDLQIGLFTFSRGWFNGFLSRHWIVLRFITNTAQSLPSDYKEQIY